MRIYGLGLVSKKDTTCPTENSYRLSTWLFTSAVSQTWQNSNATMCNTMNTFFLFLILGCQNTQWAEVQTSAWECFLLIPVTQIFDCDSQNDIRKNKILNHDLKRNCRTVMFIPHRRCCALHNKEGLPDICHFMHVSCHGPLKCLLCNGREACTRGR